MGTELARRRALIGELIQGAVAAVAAACQSAMASARKVRKVPQETKCRWRLKVL